MADRTARFFEDAKVELLNGVAYYNQRTPGAGERLLEDVFQTADRICEDPNATPSTPSMAIAAGAASYFPIPLRYDIARDGNIDIVAVAHDKRAPGYFGSRTK